MNTIKYASASIWYMMGIKVAKCEDNTDYIRHAHCVISVQN